MAVPIFKLDTVRPMQNSTAGISNALKYFSDAQDAEVEKARIKAADAENQRRYDLQQARIAKSDARIEADRARATKERLSNTAFKKSYVETPYEMKDFNPIYAGTDTALQNNAAMTEEEDALSTIKAYQVEADKQGVDVKDLISQKANKFEKLGGMENEVAQLRGLQNRVFNNPEAINAGIENKNTVQENLLSTYDNFASDIENKVVGLERARRLYEDNPDSPEALNNLISAQKARDLAELGKKEKIQELQKTIATGGKKGTAATNIDTIKKATNLTINPKAEALNNTFKGLKEYTKAPEAVKKAMVQYKKEQMEKGTPAADIIAGIKSGNVEYKDGVAWFNTDASFDKKRANAAIEKGQTPVDYFSTQEDLNTYSSGSGNQVLSNQIKNLERTPYEVEQDRIAKWTGKTNEADDFLAKIKEDAKLKEDEEEKIALAKIEADKPAVLTKQGVPEIINTGAVTDKNGVYNISGKELSLKETPLAKNPAQITPGSLSKGLSSENPFTTVARWATPDSRGRAYTSRDIAKINETLKARGVDTKDIKSMQSYMSKLTDSGDIDAVEALIENRAHYDQSDEGKAIKERMKKEQLQDLTETLVQGALVGPVGQFAEEMFSGYQKYKKLQKALKKAPVDLDTFIKRVNQKTGAGKIVKGKKPFVQGKTDLIEQFGGIENIKKSHTKLMEQAKSLRKIARQKGIPTATRKRYKMQLEDVNNQINNMAELLN